MAAIAGFAWAIGTNTHIFEKADGADELYGRHVT
jgi:hypothetical protein